MSIVYNELAKTGITLSPLWVECCDKYEAEHTFLSYHSIRISRKSITLMLPRRKLRLELSVNSEKLSK